MDKKLYEAYLNILHAELVPAMGCTEPIAIALTAAKAKTHLEGDVKSVLINALAINSGVVCDGAKASCAAKIASAVESGLLGMQMYMHGKEFYGGDGIVARDVESTIRNVGQLAQSGMAETDKEIIRIMLKE